jgi:hypothetical protein
VAWRQQRQQCCSSSASALVGSERSRAADIKKRHITRPQGMRRNETSTGRRQASESGTSQQQLQHAGLVCLHINPPASR